MDARQAVNAAKLYILDMLRDEDPSNVGLEEIEFDQETNSWLVTIGFSRPWNSVRDSASLLTGQPSVKRAYRVITINDGSEQILSMKRRENVDA